MYVDRFDPSHHCMDCLKGSRERRLHREIGDIESLELSNDWPYFYLCGLGRAPRRDSNVHLAVSPRQGAVASVGSLYGVTFTIHDALALRVDRLPKRWMGLDKEFTDCRNFQFGVQQFGYKLADVPVDTDSQSLLPEQAPSHSEVPTQDVSLLSKVL
jgi:hypothetical protein